MWPDLARSADEPDLRRLLRDNTMDGRIRLTFEREPNYAHGAAVGNDGYEVIVARDDATGRAAAMGQCSTLRAYVAGKVARVRYLHLLRADRSAPGYARGIVRGHEKLHALHADEAPCPVFTSIVADNRAARRFVAAGLNGMPAFRPLGRLATLAIPAGASRRQRRRGVDVARAGPESLDEVVDCLERNHRAFDLAPVWTTQDLMSSTRARGLAPEDFHVVRRAGRVVGCLALWDQRAFKQTVVRGYGPWLGRLRPLFNLAAPRLGAVRLPAPGARLKSAFVSHVAVDDDDDDPEVMLALLAAVRDTAAARGLDYLVLGLAEGRPLLDAIREDVPCRTYASLIYQVTWPNEHAAAVPPLGARRLHPEAAIL